MTFGPTTVVPTASPQYLPLVHGTPQISFHKIAKSNKVVPTKCPTLKQDLAYFFYGRFAFRVDPGNPGSPAFAAAPCVIVLDPTSVSSIENVFPFDSGAFDMYKNGPIHSSATLDDFRCANDLILCESLVCQVWNDRKHYVLFDLSKGLKSPTAANPDGDLYMQMYMALIAGVGLRGIDDRRGTIEISTKREVLLSARNVLGLVLPTQSLDSVDIQNFIRSCPNLRLQTYGYYGDAPIQYHRLVVERTQQILTELGFL